MPIFPGKGYEDWDLEAPAGGALDEVRPIRDEIRRRVADLIDGVTLPADASTLDPTRR